MSDTRREVNEKTTSRTESELSLSNDKDTTPAQPPSPPHSQTSPSSSSTGGYRSNVARLEGQASDSNVIVHPALSPSDSMSSTSTGTGRRSGRNLDRFDWIQSPNSGVEALSDDELWADLMRYANSRIGIISDQEDVLSPTMLGKLSLSNEEQISVEPDVEQNTRASSRGRHASVKEDDDAKYEDDRPVVELIKEYSDLEEHDFLGTLLYSTFSQISKLGKAFVKPGHGNLVDLFAVREAHARIYKCPPFVASSISMGAGTLLDHVKLGLQTLTPNHLGAYYVLLELGTYMDSEFNSHVLPRLLEVIATLDESMQSQLERLIESSLKQHSSLQIKREDQHLSLVNNFKNLVLTLHHFIMNRLISMTGELNPNTERSVQHATQVLGLFYSMNERMHLLPYTDFYNDLINDHLQIKDDYPKWKTGEGFSFCNYPYVLTTATKSDILKVESMIQMRHELQNAFFRALFVGINSPYLILEVRRDNLIRDAMYQLQGKNSHDLKKQLRITFVGEDGIDEGGVQKEFFQLIIKELFDSMYGIFKANPQTRVVWFSNTDPDKDMIEEYTLIGRLIGLAIYNGVILDLTFPTAFYKKLCDRSVDIGDLEEWDEDLARGLKKLLSYDGDVSEFERYFEIELEDWTGHKSSVELCEGGASKKVNNENREEFVNLYVDYLLNKTCERQFEALKEGFYSVIGDTAISLFRPEELSELVVGSQTLDFEELRGITQYDGFDAETSKTVKYFWEAVNELSEEEKKRLLFFATGSDRVPIGGLSKLNFVIAKNGDDATRLPTSHTCYNVLMLSEYPSTAVLKERLLTALKYADCGFFLN